MKSFMGLAAFAATASAIRLEVEKNEKDDDFGRFLKWANSHNRNYRSLEEKEFRYGQWLRNDRAYYFIN